MPSLKGVADLGHDDRIACWICLAQVLAHPKIITIELIDIKTLNVHQVK